LRSTGHDTFIAPRAGRVKRLVKSTIARLRKLEERMGLGPETEAERRLQVRMQEGIARVAAARARGLLGPPPDHNDPRYLARREALRKACAGLRPKAWF
jgi:hypothetical protein